jgi:hypothetical protein
LQVEDDGDDDTVFAIWCLLEDLNSARTFIREAWKDYADGRRHATEGVQRNTFGRPCAQTAHAATVRASALQHANKPVELSRKAAVPSHAASIRASALQHTSKPVELSIAAAGIITCAAFSNLNRLYAGQTTTLPAIRFSVSCTRHPQQRYLKLTAVSFVSTFSAFHELGQQSWSRRSSVFRKS